MALRSSPRQQALTRVGRTGSHRPTSLASETHGAAVDSNLVAALIIALGRAGPAPAASGTLRGGVDDRRRRDAHPYAIGAHGGERLAASAAHRAASQRQAASTPPRRPRAPTRPGPIDPPMAGRLACGQPREEGRAVRLAPYPPTGPRFALHGRQRTTVRRPMFVGRSTHHGDWPFPGRNRLTGRARCASALGRGPRAG